MAWVKFGSGGALRKPFNALTDEQRELLTGVFRTGARSFKRYERATPRWVEELSEWGYIEWHSPLIWNADSPDYYSLTSAGWEATRRSLRGKHKKSR